MLSDVTMLCNLCVHRAKRALSGLAKATGHMRELLVLSEAVKGATEHSAPWKSTLCLSWELWLRHWSHLCNIGEQL
jgi:hypothetical protein